jgi:S1-C subfamily serine protease
MSIPIVLTCLCLGWAEPPSGSGSATAFEIVSSIETVVADAIERAEPSVVAIARTKNETNPDHETWAVRGRPRAAAASKPNDTNDVIGRQIVQSADYVSFDYGSGVVIGDQGQILTAFHVVRGASFLLVRAVGEQQFEAEVIAADPRSDLAVIAPRVMPGGEPPKLKPIAIGDSSKLRKGGFLVALGNPFNAARDGRPSASWGILANVARRLEPEVDGWENLRRDHLNEYPTLLQLDSKLNLGMSGGAVVNMRGELVGLTTTACSPAGFDAQAGYAIPMDRIGKRLIETLKLGKEVEYGLLGIAPIGVTNRVKEVAINSPAAEGQILVEDEIVAVNESPIANFDDLILAIQEFSPGEPIRLKIIRKGKPLERTVVLAKFRVEGEVIATTRPAPWRGIRVDYMNLNTRPQELGFFNMPTRGVVVTAVEDGSPAAAAGLKKGQIIAKVNDQPVISPRQFEAAVAKKTGSVSIVTDRGALTIGTGR